MRCFRDTSGCPKRPHEPEVTISMRSRMFPSIASGDRSSGVRSYCSLALFGWLRSGNGVFGHLNFDLIGDFEDEGLIFHAGDDTVDP